MSSQPRPGGPGGPGGPLTVIPGGPLSPRSPLRPGDPIIPLLCPHFSSVLVLISSSYERTLLMWFWLVSRSPSSSV